MQRALAALHTLQRFPALQRALRWGVTGEMRGARVHIQPVLIGDRILFPVVASGAVQTEWGDINVSGTIEVSCSLETAAGLLDEADRRGVLPRLDALVTGTPLGRPLLAR